MILVPEVPKPAAGFIYVIYIDDSAERRFFKIGLSSSFSCRFGSHQTSSPFAVCVAIAYFVGDMRQEETYLHQEFAAKRVRGEWFRLTDEDLCAIAARAKLV
ncbi:MAG: GIY-YIG nuclease family protein [Gammaproteobacteria bacterium]